MMQPPQVVVSGMGIVSAIGLTVAENLDALRQARSGIRPLSLVSSAHKGKLLAGEIPLSDAELYQSLGIPEGEAYTRTALLALLAMREATAKVD